MKEISFRKNPSARDILMRMSVGDRIFVNDTSISISTMRVTASSLRRDTGKTFAVNIDPTARKKRYSVIRTV